MTFLCIQLWLINLNKFYKLQCSNTAYHSPHTIHLFPVCISYYPTSIELFGSSASGAEKGPVGQRPDGLRQCPLCRRPLQTPSFASRPVLACAHSSSCPGSLSLLQVPALGSPPKLQRSPPFFGNYLWLINLGLQVLQTTVQ